ncbi:MAG: Zn-dependent hydrolase [Cyclobacteriaceae bacterium]|nr:Zn-dependent hydrolase [Cyclobacteriaceae bacterium]
MKPLSLIPLLLAVLIGLQCSPPESENDPEESSADSVALAMQKKVDKYVAFELTSDLNHLSENQRQMIPILIEASKIMDSLFWYQAYGDRQTLLNSSLGQAAKRFVNINYGPWDRLDANAPFLEDVAPKPAGANFYPADMTKEEFDNSSLPDKNSLYTFLRRNDHGDLITVPYHEQFASQLRRAADLLMEAATLADDPGFKNYLQLRSQALVTDDFQPSDLAWMDMKTNPIDIVIGPIESYEDQLFGTKTSYEAYVLIKDQEWSERLAKYTTVLPELQRGLPVPDQYKKETPGANADLNAYDVVYYAGDCNSGSKTIAINLPNDEEVQLAKGTRRLQLKNAMQAKFDKILVPISQLLIAEDQRKHITFDAFFANTMFHEVAHGLGIKNTIDGSGTVRAALKEHASALEEGKADILGLYMITQLHEKGEIAGDLSDYYTTFLAGIFRSVRFGASSAHGKANMIRFNFFKQYGAFEREASTGHYRVNFDKMQEAMSALSEKILTLQGDGDYQGVAQLVSEMGLINDALQADLDLLEAANIPVDIVFEQGTEHLGL